MDNMTTIIPEKIIRQKYSEVMMPILEKLKSSYFENGRLSALRDTLLPKLMSGEIRVPIEEVAADV